MPDLDLVIDGEDASDLFTLLHEAEPILLCLGGPRPKRERRAGRRGHVRRRMGAAGDRRGHRTHRGLDSPDGSRRVGRPRIGRWPRRRARPMARCPETSAVARAAGSSITPSSSRCTQRTVVVRRDVHARKTSCRAVSPCDTLRAVAAATRRMPPPRARSPRGRTYVESAVQRSRANASASPGLPAAMRAAPACGSQRREHRSARLRSLATCE